NNTGLRITEYPLYPGSGAKAGKAIRLPQTSMSLHPEIMPDFLTLEIVKSPSYSDPFSCYFHPLEKEKSQKNLNQWVPEENELQSYLLEVRTLLAGLSDQVAAKS